METKALMGGAIAAAIGAIAWGLVGWLTGMELGILAWGIGGLVGLGVMRAGTPSASTAIAAGVLALVAIMGGKILAIQFALPGFARDFAEEQVASELSPSLYQEMKADAAAWADHEGSVEEFMIERGYTEAEEMLEVGSEEVADFQQYSVPQLEALAGSNAPTYEKWREQRLDEVTDSILEGISLATVLPYTFSLFDILWIILGVSTAWRMGMGGAS